MFDPSAYPSPWPLEPFKRHSWLPTESIKNFVHKPKLQKYIPQYLLPRKLIVHDPWGLLDGNKCTGDKSTPWNEKDDNIVVYSLDLSYRTKRHKEDLAEHRDERDKERKTTQAFLENPHSSMEKPDGLIYHPEQRSQEDCIGPAKPPVYVVFPRKPVKMIPSEAHLYLSPAQCMGEGHHSFVYRAEFEIPRSLVVEDEICEQCIYDDVKRILEEEDGPNGERRDPRWDEKSGNYVLKSRSWPARKVVLESAEHELEPGYESTKVEYEGPYRAIETRVGWQNLERAPYCEHLREDRIHPLTVKVEVAAKLSKEHDSQLSCEGEKYAAFPKHFFEHRNGYALNTEIHSQPAPCGAIVPQFYGYYRLPYPSYDSEPESDDEECKRFQSPILLLEDCGNQIAPELLTADER